MWSTRGGGRVIVVGENIHATRVVLRAGKSATTDERDRPCVRFKDAAGTERLLPVPSEVVESETFAKGRIKLVEAAIRLARNGGDEAEIGVALVHGLAVRQAAAGADYLDLNVDEVTANEAERAELMGWLVRTVEEVATVPVALDSSSAVTIAAGIDASRCDPSTLLLNSATTERLDVLDLAVRHGCSVVASAAGGGPMPKSAQDRIAGVRAIVDAAASRGIGAERLHVDPLVIPVGVAPEAGAQFLDAVTALRETFGSAIHITGGFSNVSFGLPARRLLNEVFFSLAAEAGADSAIVDPIALDADRIACADRTARPWQLAADLLTGRDPYGGAYLRAYRAGELTIAD